MSSYAELHCLSNFSFLRGASHAHELVRQAKQLGYTALAITDECSMAGIVRAWEAAQDVGLHLIVGSEFVLDDGLKLVLLAQDHDGYSNLCRLITTARRRSEKGSYRIGRGDFFCRHSREGGNPFPCQQWMPASAGMTNSTGCLALWIPGPNPTETDAAWVRDCFTPTLTLPPRGGGNPSVGIDANRNVPSPLTGEGLDGGDRLPTAWIAVELHRGPDDRAYLERLQLLSQRFGLPLVAAGGVHMHAPERRALQDTLTAVRHRCTVAEAGDRLFPNAERHLRPLPVLRELYPEALLEEACAIAQRCTFRLDELRYQYPHELVPDGQTPSAYLRQLTYDGACRRWPDGVPRKITALIEKELALIAELEYEHYFLTVEDIVRFARAQGILCQGRGSAANSVVCYALGVTEVDPSRVETLFERFVSKERAEPPDIDIDFEHQRREEVIQYIYAKYGRERAALAATVICYRPRSAVRDVGKALGLSLDQVDALAKSLHWFEDISAMGARLRELGFDPDAPVIRLLAALVTQVLGFPRHLSQHVGGFVISEHPLSQLVPVENAAMPERTLIQWDKEDLETLGLLKVDVLGLGMLSAIRRALEMVGEFRNEMFTIADVPPEDPATYDMLCRGDSVGVFQVESRAQTSMLPRLKPRCYYDLVIEVAIIRPGPIQGGMVHPYLRRRKGEEKVGYPSKALEKVLSRTLGVPLFQEQVMQIAMVAAGFSAGEADQVRRSMAAWQRRGGLEHFREKLIGGMLARGYAPGFAEQIYRQVLGFGSYGFPESHAASFALLVYVSAWLKCHEPAAFCAGLLNSQPMGFYAPAQLIADARRAGVEVRPVDVLHSDWDCTLESSGQEGGMKPALRLGLRLVDGLPEEEGRRVCAVMRDTPAVILSEAKDLLSDRNAHGSRILRCAQNDTDVDHLTHAARLSRRTVNALAEAGALASLAGHRHRARWAALGIERLPGMLAGQSAREGELALPAPTEGQDIAADYRALGFTLGRHPLELLRKKLTKLGALRSTDLPHYANGRWVTVAGLVTHRQRPETASGVLFISLEDETGVANLILWPSVQAAQRRAVLESSLMVVSGELQNAEGVIHVLAHRVQDYSRWLGQLTVTSRDFH